MRIIKPKQPKKEQSPDSVIESGDFRSTAATASRSSVRRRASRSGKTSGLEWDELDSIDDLFGMPDHAKSEAHDYSVHTTNRVKRNVTKKRNKTSYSSPKPMETRAGSSTQAKKRPLAKAKSVKQGAEANGPLSAEIDDSKQEFNRLLAKGVHLLAMREHSVKELTDKLKVNSDSNDIVYAVIDELLNKNYVSDERFTESYVRSRRNRGFGPMKIRSELSAKGIDSSMASEWLEASSPIWFDYAREQYHKKYGDMSVSDYNEWSKRARFMQSRGFSMEHIKVALPCIEFD